MVTEPVSPKWVTPDRKAKLLELWLLTNNRCLLGHKTCPIASHYVYYKEHTSYVGQPVSIPAKDKSGNPIRDTDGNQLYLKLYHPVKVTEATPILIRLFDHKANLLIKEWIAEDRAIWQAEQRVLHQSADRTEPLRGRFSAVSRDIWYDRQPLYYLEGYGISGLILKPFAKVRIAGGYVTLFVNLGDTLKAGVSKSQRRKAIRYGKPLPLPVQEQVRQQVVKAVLDYLNH